MTEIAAPPSGERPELAALFEQLYPELKRLANSRLSALGPGKTITPTVLVHETYMKLLRSGNLNLEERRWLFGAAARAMHDIVVDYIRASGAAKRGGDRVRVTFSEEQAAAGVSWDFEDLQRALAELEEVDPAQRELVDMKFFAGFTEREIATVTQTPYRTVQRQWERARAFLHARLEDDRDSGVLD